MRSLTLLIVLLFAGMAEARADSAESAKILKVLPQFLDVKGRASPSPSLFDRDAYQAELRDNPSRRAAMRFNVNWKAKGYEELILRIQLRGGPVRKPHLITLEEKVHPGFFSKWTKLTLSGDEYRNFGDLIGWRATLWSGTNQVAEQKSFLW